jgi:hypothetical protein
VKHIYVVEPHSDTAALEMDLLQGAGFGVRVVTAQGAEAALLSDEGPTSSAAPVAERTGRDGLGERAHFVRSCPTAVRVTLRSLRRYASCVY